MKFEFHATTLTCQGLCDKVSAPFAGFLPQEIPISSPC